MECPACGEAAPPAARFCPACGHALATPSDQRRVATVLFADLVGFTTLSEDRDPEHVKNLVDRCFERLAADVAAYGGRVDKVVGDAMVALFGAPVAHEDDAERAVRAALQMQRTLAAHAAELGVEVRMRIGINTGEVLVGSLRADDDYTAVGDVVNVAQRLQGVAEPGTVVVGPETEALTRRVIRYEPLGRLEVRGREGPVEAWRALDAVAPPGYRPRRMSTPLIGRDVELGLLRGVLASAAARRRPHFVLVTGDAGVGKSRLVEELALLARREHDAAIFVGRSVPYGEANPWWPVAEILRQALGIDPADPFDAARDKARRGVAAATRAEGPEADRIVEGLLYLMGLSNPASGTTPLSDVDPARAVEEAIRSLLAVVEGIATRHLVLLFIADIHWADRLVFDLVDTLLDRLRGLPVVVMATARPGIEERWTPQPGRANAISLHLDPLDEGATAQLVTAVLGEDSPPEVRRVLVDRSGGNPFFVEELASLLTEAGVVGGGTETGRALALAELPATLRGLVAARLDAVDPRERALVEDAAVIGRVGPVAALVALAEGRGVSEVATLLDRLAEKDLLVVGEGRFEFKSDLVREVAYETLAKAERARRHAPVARWLEQRARATGREDEYLEQVAHHYRVAAQLVTEVGAVEGVPDDVRSRAVEWLERAARRQQERGSHPAAVQLLDDALGLLTADEDDRRQCLLLDRARARAVIRDLPGARADLREVIEKAEARGDRGLQARALTVLGDVHQREGDLDASLEVLERAMNLANEIEDRQALAEALRQWGVVQLFAGRLEEAQVAIAEALEAFRFLGDRRSAAWALQNLAWIAFYRGETNVADRRLSESAATFEEIGDWGGRSWARGLLGFVRLTQGRLEEAGALADEVVVDAERGGDRWAYGMTRVLQASVALWLGHTSAAAARAEEAVRIFEEMGDDFGRGLAAATLTRACVYLGRIAEAKALLGDVRQALAGQEAQRSLALTFTANVACALGDPDTALELVESAGEDGRFLPAEMLATRALALIQAGRVGEALPLLAEVRSAPSLLRVKGGPRDAEGVATLAGAIEALALVTVGRLEDAVEVAAWVAGQKRGTYLDQVGAAVARAMAHARRGEVDEARRLADEALAVVDGTEDRLNQAVVRLARAHVLELLGDEGAGASRAEAQARFDAMGVEPYGWETAFANAASGVVPEAAPGTE